MRSSKTPLVTLLSLLLTLFATQVTAHAGDETDADEYDVSARVVRVSLIHGDVSLKRHDSADWEAARLNTPLVEGDTLATAGDARAEIQIDARNFVRVASDSVIKIITLRNDGIALSLAEGTATLRLARFDKDHEYFEIDAPKTTIATEKQGVYRIDVARNGGIHLTVRDGGRARLYSDTAGFTVKDGHGANLDFDGDEAGDWQLISASANDSWDAWVNDRERYLATRFKYDQTARYYDADIWGAEDLDAYGNWAYANDYGWIWRPHVTVINNYNDWSPYRYGQWTWCQPYGWTWVGDEPWGWAPYHYGRWVYYNNDWAWCPHSYYPHQRSWWRPALVAFVSLDYGFGSHVCWYPLAYRQRDPRSAYFRSRDRLAPLRSEELADLRRINPAYRRAVTAVPARDFGNRAVRPQPANSDLARRVVGAQPLRGDLPVRPAVVPGNNTNAAGRVSAARPAPGIPGAGLARPTGAAPRTPGVALDNDLRRLRVFNGRDPVSVARTPNDGGALKVRPTGAVLRPAVPSGSRINRDPDPNRGGNEVTPVGRSSRPTRPRDERPANPTPVVVTPEPRDRRAPSPPSSQPSPPPNSRSTPVRSVAPEKRERTDRIERPAVPSRTETPTPRSQPPARTEPPPARSAPPAERRSEPPQRSSPAPPQRPAPEKTREERPSRPERKPAGS
jgi:hypothetical protein